MRSTGLWVGIAVVSALAAAGAGAGLLYTARERGEAAREVEGLRARAKEADSLRGELARLRAQSEELRADLALFGRMFRAGDEGVRAPAASPPAAAPAAPAGRGETALREENARLRADLALYRRLFLAREEGRLASAALAPAPPAAPAPELASLRQQLSKARGELALAREGLADLKGKLERLEELQAKGEGRVRDLTMSLEETRRRREEARRAQAEALAALRASYEKLMERLRGEVKEQEVQIRRYKDMLTIRFLDRVLFDSGRAELTPEGRRTLDGVLDLIRSHPDRMVHVEGHTDTVPISAELARRYPTNWELSTARAAAVVRYLESKGIPPKRLSAVGFGPHRPVADNATPGGRAQNRRIVILLTAVDFAKLPQQR